MSYTDASAPDDGAYENNDNALESFEEQETENGDSVESGDTGQSDDTAPANDDPEHIEQRLEKLYGRLPKIISRITEDNGNEAYAALRSLLKYFKKINELEQTRLQPGENFEPLSLSRLYELAASGGGGDTQELEELRQANEQFQQEYHILRETVESLTFQMEAAHKKSADELLENGEVTAVPLDELKVQLSQFNNNLNRLTQALETVESGNEAQAGEKSLEERILEALDDNQVSADVLQNTSTQTTRFGRVLRRFGLKHDPKDSAALQQLVPLLLRTNRKVMEVRDSIRPMQDQIQQLHNIVQLLELYAGHEERQGQQYQEAMQEVERLQNRLQRFEDSYGQLEEIDQEIEDRRARITEREQELADLERRKDEIFHEVREKRKQIDRLSGKNDELTQEIRTKEHKPEDLQPQYEQLQTEHEQLQSEHEQLQTEHEQLHQQYQSDIAALKNKMRELDDGILVEKLEAEVQRLREMVVQHEQERDREREYRKAFEERVETWITNEDKARKEAEKAREQAEKAASKWQKRASLSYGFMAAASGVAAVGGYATFGALNAMDLGVGWSLVTSAGMTTAIVSAMGAGGAAMEGENIALGAGIGAAIGAGASIIAGLTMTITYQDSMEQLQEECGELPCMIVKEDGGYTSKPLSETFDGKVVTYDFTSDGEPELRIEQQPTPQSKTPKPDNN